MSSAGLRTLQSLTSLRKLDVSDMRRVDAEGVSALAALPWLTELRMCGSHAVAAGEGSLDTLMDSSENLVRALRTRRNSLTQINRARVNSHALPQ